MEVLPADQWAVKDQAQAWEIPSLAAQVQISPDAILSLNVVFSSATGDPKLSFKANGSCGPPF